MAERVRSYLSQRHAFGFRLSIAGWQLEQFASFADGVAPGEPFTMDLALRWAQSSPTGKQVTAARRLLILRPFAKYLRTINPLTEVPPNRLLGPAQYRYIPHIYNDNEIRALLNAARHLHPHGGLRAHSMYTYIGLLACTGMRPQEPLRLDRTDVDIAARTITVRETKFSKSRIVVLHPTAAVAMQEYAGVRDRHVPSSESSAFFLSDDGSAFTHRKAVWAFSYLRRQLGWSKRPGRLYPRLYDLRHTFVCHRLLAWHRDRIDVQVVLPALSTYLGHVKITDTYWYVTAIPELMSTVSERFESFFKRRGDGRHDIS
jgi:integrase